jgi:hypothetical protein
MKRSILIVIALVFLISVTLISMPSIVRMGTIIPGPEGIKCLFYGAQFADFSSTLHKITEMSPNQVLEGPKKLGTEDMTISVGFPDPSSPTFSKYNSHAQWQTLSIERRPVTTQDINQHGFGTDPTVGCFSSPTTARYLEYYKKKTEVGNQVTFEKFVVQVVPVDVVIQLSARGDINTWESAEPRWSNTHLWWVLDTNAWYQTFTESQILDMHPPANSTLTAYNYRGGFPIWGWIQQWDPMVWEQKNSNDQTSSTPNPPVQALDCVQIYPSVSGREITLYTQPGYNYNLILAQDIVKDPNLLDASLIQYFPMLPDPRFAVNAYFSIYVDRLYPYRHYTGPVWNIGESWEKWSPTVYLRIRFLYAMYGEFVYLWTKQEEQTFEYTWQNRSGTYAYEQGQWDRILSGIGSVLSNPLFWLATGLIGTFIMIVILVVFFGPVIMPIFQSFLGGKQRGRRK